MKAKFAQSALVIGLFAGTAMEAHAAATAGDVVQIGCTVPAQGFGGATVYSVDQGSTSATSAYTALASGTVCSKAINALTNASSAITTAAYELAANTNIVIPGTGYSLQQFTLQAASTAPAGVSYAMVGCTAPATTGGTVYSVDAKKGTGGSSTTLIAATTSVATGVNCAGALNELRSSWDYAQEVATDVGSPALTYYPDPSTNLVVNTNGYSLQQFLLQ